MTENSYSRDCRGHKHSRLHQTCSLARYEHLQGLVHRRGRTRRLSSTGALLNASEPSSGAMAADVRIEWRVPRVPEQEMREGVERQLQRPPLLLTGDMEKSRDEWDGRSFKVTWMRSDHGPYYGYVEFAE